jgi:hypothetical protein
LRNYARSRRRSAHHPGASRTLQFRTLDRPSVSIAAPQQAIPSPLEAIEVSRPDEIKRSRRRMNRLGGPPSRWQTSSMERATVSGNNSSCHESAFEDNTRQFTATASRWNV